VPPVVVLPTGGVLELGLALAKIGIEDAHLHSLRHSFVFRLEERNVPVVIASALVGHSKVTTTQAVYRWIRGDRKAVESCRPVTLAGPATLRAGCLARSF
jgi:hypothetical protein